MALIKTNTVLTSADFKPREKAIENILIPIEKIKENVVKNGTIKTGKDLLPIRKLLEQTTTPGLELKMFSKINPKYVLLVSPLIIFIFTILTLMLKITMFLI
jgi:hypothetical protein